MAEGKKTDDYTVEMSKLDQGSKNFEPASVPAPRSSFSSGSLANNPILPVLAYCGSSILMTVMNKYVLSGLDFNLNFFLLCVQVRCFLDRSERGCNSDASANCEPRPQSIVCVIAIQTCKALGIITFRDFSSDEAKKCWLSLNSLTGAFLSS